MTRDRAWAAALLLAVGCGTPAPPVEGGTDTGGTDPGGSSEDPGGSTTGTPPPADDTSTTGEPAPTCVARRYALLDDDACGRAAIGDLDGDGADDLLVIPRVETFLVFDGDRRLHTYAGGSPQLPLPEIHCCVEIGDPHELALVDVNGDGRADPVYAVDQHEISGDVGTSFVAVEMLIRGPLGGYLGERRLVRGSELFSDPSFVAAGALLPDRTAVAVVDGPSSVGLFAADGLSLVPAWEGPWLELAGDVRALGTTDLDGDGLDDVVAVLPDRLALLRSPGDGTLVALEDAVPDVLDGALLVGDVDGQGGRDLVLPGAGGLAVGLVTPGAIAWQVQPSIVVSSPSASTLLDADGDGVLDLAAVEGGELVVWLGTGDGTFAVPPLPLSEGLGEVVENLVTGDLDGDGRDDVVACDELGVLVVTGGLG